MSIKNASLKNEVLLTREEFTQSYSYPWRGEREAEVLDSHEIFRGKKDAIRYDNPNLPLISIVGLYTQLSGTLYAKDYNSEGKPLGFNGTLGNRSRQQPTLIQRCKKDLGLTFHSAEKDHRFGENGGQYARLLYLLGFSTSLPEERENLPKFHRNSKSERGTKIPNYLTFLKENYKSLNISNHRIARRLLHDLITVYFDACSSFSEDNFTCLLSLTSKHSKVEIEEDANFLTSTINLLYPEFEASAQRNLKITTLKKKNLAYSPYYQGVITFSAEQIARVSTPENRFPIKTCLISEPRFSRKC